MLTTGIDLTDTQTGLRAYPSEMLPWLQEVDDERFEYELELLLRAHGAGHAILEEPIATVYLEGNASSHFRPVVDSLRVYAPLVRFAASSAVATVVDYVVLLAVAALTGNVLLSVIGARVTSAGTNYLTNSRVVFADRSSSSARRYAALVAGVLVLNAGLMELLVTVAGVPLLAAKVLTEALLFGVSFVLQRRYVFPTRRPAPVASTPEGRRVDTVSTGADATGGW